MEPMNAETLAQVARNFTWSIWTLPIQSFGAVSPLRSILRRAEDAAYASAYAAERGRCHLAARRYRLCVAYLCSAFERYAEARHSSVLRGRTVAGDWPRMPFEDGMMQVYINRHTLIGLAPTALSVNRQSSAYNDGECL